MAERSGQQVILPPGAAAPSEAVRGPLARRAVDDVRDRADQRRQRGAAGPVSMAVVSANQDQADELVDNNPGP